MKENQNRLIKRLKAGDKEAFEEVYRMYYVSLCYYCITYVGSMENAEEIVQSIFLKLWVKRTEIQIITSLKAYLYKAVQNQSLNYFRRQKINNKYLLNQNQKQRGNALSVNAQSIMEYDELQKTLKMAILKLPKKRRQIFEMSRFEELQYNEIAKKLSISIKTVEAQMTKALKTLRKALKVYLPFVSIVFFINKMVLALTTVLFHIFKNL